MIGHILAGVAGVTIGGFIIYTIKSYQKKQEFKKLTDLLDAPYPFELSGNNDSYYILFDFGDDMKLWCDYKFGIREDGLYGLNEITIKGLNSPWRSDFSLKIGQSVFPLMNKMDKLEGWLEEQVFDLKWDESFKRKWEETKQKLNNLRYLETKSKEQEKKKK